jgi:hypothetical protein
MIVGGVCRFEDDADRDGAAQAALHRAFMELIGDIDTTKIYHLSFETSIVDVPPRSKEYRVLIRIDQYRKEDG